MFVILDRFGERTSHNRPVIDSSKKLCKKVGVSTSSCLQTVSSELSTDSKQKEHIKKNRGSSVLKHISLQSLFALNIMYVTVHIVSRQPKNYQLNGLDRGESCGEVMIGLWILLLCAVIVIHCQLLGGGVLGSEYVHKSQTDPRFLGQYHED